MEEKAAAEGVEGFLERERPLESFDGRKIQGNRQGEVDRVVQVLVENLICYTCI